jgi:hypothetical protein
MTTIAKLMENQPDYLTLEEDKDIWFEMANTLKAKETLTSAGQIINFVTETFQEITGININNSDLENTTVSLKTWREQIPKTLIQQYYLHSF